MIKDIAVKSVFKIILSVVVITSFLYFTYPYLYPKIYPYLVTASGQGDEIEYGKCVTEGEINSVLEEYFRADFEKNHSADAKGELFCNSVILWQNNISEEEKVVYADVSCQDVIIIAKDLRSDSSSGFFGFFKMGKQDDAWKIVDYDNRISSKEEPKDWVADNIALLPKTILGNCDLATFWQENLQKIGKHMEVEVPQYSFAHCSGDRDCTDEEVCKFRGLFDSYGIQNQCVKKCSNHTECGAGYICRKQCLYGENNCPRTGVNVCTLDLIYPEFDKQNELPL
ncbi:MAG: hypothetical protein WC178_03030 [Candidatus Paceibacterota bacterium]